jgi:hypothetical protein
METSQLLMWLKVANYVSCAMFIAIGIYCIPGGTSVAHQKIPVYHLSKINDTCIGDFQVDVSFYTSPIAWESLDMFLLAFYLFMVTFFQKYTYDQFVQLRYNWMRWYILALSNSSEIYIVCLLVGLRVDYVLMSFVVISTFMYSIGYIQEQRKLSDYKPGVKTSAYAELSDKVAMYIPMIISMTVFIYMWALILDSMYATLLVVPVYLSTLAYSTLVLSALIWVILGIEVAEFGTFKYNSDIDPYTFYKIELVYTLFIVFQKLFFGLTLLIGYTTYYAGEDCTI